MRGKLGSDFAEEEEEDEVDVAVAAEVIVVVVVVTVVVVLKTVALEAVKASFSSTRCA